MVEARRCGSTARDDIFLCLTSVFGVHDMTIGSTNPDNRGIDALLPDEIAEKAVKKLSRPPYGKAVNRS